MSSLFSDRVIHVGTRGWAARTVLIGSLAFAAACVKTNDTDPGDTDTDTDADTDVSDNVAPTVMSTAPVDAEIEVAVDRSIDVVFSEELDPSSVNGTTFVVTEGGVSVAGAVTLASNVATFHPAADLAFGATLDVVISTGVKDLAGNPLYAPYAFAFTTVDVADTLGPKVTTTAPLDLATKVSLGRVVNAWFDEPLDPATVDGSTFTLTQGASSVSGLVSVHDATATFVASEDLIKNSTYVATLTTGIRDLAGNPLEEKYVWTFETGGPTPPGFPVDLGTSGNFAVLAKTGISTVPASAITGDIGVSPAAASYITGFSLIADSTNVFSTSTQVTGKVYASDYAVPTPANMTTAISDMELSFTAAAGRAPDVTELGAGNIGGMTLAPGVYAWGTGLLIPTDVALAGSATDVWIFQIAGNLTMSSGAAVRLSGGAVPKNVFWQVAGLVDFGTTAHCEGVVLTQTSATLRTGATVNGRLLAQTAVSLDGATVVQP